MSVYSLHHEIARSTGEELRTLRRHGFDLLRPLPLEEMTDDDRAPLMIDWDAYDAPGATRWQQG